MTQGISHFWGADLSIGATGDLALVSGDACTQQSLIRRLMTAAGDYIQQPTYGAGLGGYVGQPLNVGLIQGAIKQQMKKEAAILQNPPPTVTVTTDNVAGVVATISYFISGVPDPVLLTFPLTST